MWGAIKKAQRWMEARGLEFIPVRGRAHDALANCGACVMVPSSYYEPTQTVTRRHVTHPVWIRRAQWLAKNFPKMTAIQIRHETLPVELLIDDDRRKASGEKQPWYTPWKDAPADKNPGAEASSAEKSG